jgi:hypothetical protein
MADRSEPCNCDQALELQQRLEEAEAKLAALARQTANVHTDGMETLTLPELHAKLRAAQSGVCDALNSAEVPDWLCHDLGVANLELSRCISSVEMMLREWQKQIAPQPGEE